MNSPDLHDGGAEQIGPLVDAGGHQQASVGAALDGDQRGARVLLLDQVLGGGLEVVENILLVEEAARVVPSLTVLSEQKIKFCYDYKF